MNEDRIPCKNEAYKGLQKRTSITTSLMAKCKKDLNK
jgi:hypothetical protein